MRQWGLNPSAETYLTLACACARHGDITAMEKVIAEASTQGIPFRYRGSSHVQCFGSGMIYSGIQLGIFGDPDQGIFRNNFNFSSIIQ